MGTQQRIVQVETPSFGTGDDTLDLEIRKDDLALVDFNLLPMLTLHRVQAVASAEIRDCEAAMHNKMVEYKKQLQHSEMEAQHLRDKHATTLAAKTQAIEEKVGLEEALARK